MYELQSPDIWKLSCLRCSPVWVVEKFLHIRATTVCRGGIVSSLVVSVSFVVACRRRRSAAVVGRPPTTSVVPCNGNVQAMPVLGFQVRRSCSASTASSSSSELKWLRGSDRREEQDQEPWGRGLVPPRHKWLGCPQGPARTPRQSEAWGAAGPGKRAARTSFVLAVLGLA